MHDIFANLTSLGAEYNARPNQTSIWFWHNLND